MPATPLVDSTNALKRTRSRCDFKGPAHKRQCSDDRKPRSRSVEDDIPLGELEMTLRRLEKTVDYPTLKRLTTIGRDQWREIPQMVHSIVERVKLRVAERFQCRKGENTKMLQAELYLEWLLEFEFVLAAVQNVLRAKVPVAPGKALFTILFHLIDQYMTAVDAQQDGCAYRSWVMTLVEEAKDSSTDERSEEALADAEAQLKHFDTVMRLALARYKSDSRSEVGKVAPAIGQMEETLARGCCLLSEQTGLGAETEMGFGLLPTTRNAMLGWKGQRASR
ncbi:hypothetical protein FB45DRAFT_784224 [Roridomyces roridus]|uniref:Uncharacterized protein n=1 Tax=Roridomyces roridus TaxID=1738132 RepID=A0AAD7FUQ8_9AGAR|nr:hypothetical protein FB45DRAFT_784224 [Roridomyces roridus]